MCFVEYEPVEVDSVDGRVFLDNVLATRPAFGFFPVETLKTVVRDHDHVNFLQVFDRHVFDFAVLAVVDQNIEFTVGVLFDLRTPLPV